MLRDITLGQYYQTESVLHRMDPRVKLAGTLIYMISLFLYKNLTAYILAFLFLLSVIKISKASPPSGADALVGTQTNLPSPYSCSLLLLPRAWHRGPDAIAVWGQMSPSPPVPSAASPTWLGRSTQNQAPGLQHTAHHPSPRAWEIPRGRPARPL